jgi:hypothetical protein
MLRRADAEVEMLQLINKMAFSSHLSSVAQDVEMEIFVKNM